MKRALSVLLVAVIVFSVSIASGVIKPEEAQQHTGENQIVCGTVISTHYAMSSKGQPTFLNLDKPYPNQIFTIVIWGDNRAKFKKAPEQYFDGKSICVTGVIEIYRGTPEIIVSDPSQIKNKIPR